MQWFSKKDKDKWFIKSDIGKSYLISMGDGFILTGIFDGFCDGYNSNGKRCKLNTSLQFTSLIMKTYHYIDVADEVSRYEIDSHCVFPDCQFMEFDIRALPESHKQLWNLDYSIKK